MMRTIAESVAVAASALAAHSDSPRLDAELLLGKVLGASRAALASRRDESLPERAAHAYAELIARRQQGSPVAYLVGEREFWSLRLAVTPAVLVPRPETELLVERSLDGTAKDSRLAALDLGTGSGAIALALCCERPHWRVSAVDISAAALEVAQGNARQLGCTSVTWRLGAWFEAVRGERFDLIVSNPPYVALTDPRLGKLAAEPKLALSPGRTGLEALAAIIAQAGAHLHPAGRLLLEHGSEQATAVGDLMSYHGLVGVKTFFDFSGKPRVTLGTVQPSH